MKFKHLNVWVTLLLAVVILSCETNDIEGVNVGDGSSDTPADLTNGSGLFSNNSVRERVRGISGYNGPGGFIYNRIGSRNGRTESNSVYNQIKGINSNSTAAARSENDGSGEDCYTESYTETATSYEFTLDFGEGCEVDGEFMKGSLVERGTFTDNSFSSEVVYTGFGGTEWEVTGTETYDGTWSEDEADSAVWESAYTFTSDLVETINEEGGTFEVTYQASGAERMDENSFVVESSNEIVSVSTGESYESTVTSPLVMDFTCDWEQAYIFVSGIETGSYSYVDEAGETITGTYAVDYGDGTCDNLITVTEDGESEVIDLSDIWDECEDHGDEWEDDGDDEEWDEEYYEEVVTATYEITSALVLSEDQAHYTAGKLTFNTDSAENFSVEFLVDGDVSYALITEIETGESIDATYEIAETLVTEDGCDFYVAGSLYLYAEDEKVIVEFGDGGSCTDFALITISEEDENDDEEDEENSGD